MTALFNRWLPGVTLAVWSSVLIGFSLGGHLGAFLSPTYRPWVLPAGLILLAMAMVFFIFPVDAACCRSAECGHPLSRYTGGKWLTFLILVVPVAVSAKYTPTGFSRNAMENRGIVTDASALPTAPRLATPPAPAKTASTAPAAGDPLALPLPQADPNATPAPEAAIASTPKGDTSDLESYVQKTPEGYLQAEVLDLLYAAQDSTLRKVFDGKTVSLLGQLMPDPAEGTPGGAGHRFKAVRMFMTCCAADARPVATEVEVAEMPSWPEMTWIRIVGKATFPVENGRRAALLQAEKVEQTEPPEESMLY